MPSSYTSYLNHNHKKQTWRLVLFVEKTLTMLTLTWSKLKMVDYSICGNKKSRFVKKQEAKGIWYSLGIKAPLSKIPDLNILF